jgi:hypothetical protein
MVMTSVHVRHTELLDGTAEIICHIISIQTIAVYDDDYEEISQVRLVLQLVGLSSDFTSGI